MKKRIICLLAVLMLLLPVTAALCEAPAPVRDITAAAANAAKQPKKIKITGPKTVAVGSKIKLVATVSPSGASAKVTWTSSNKKIATVSKKGVVKGKKEGKVKITAVSKANPKVKKTYTITVKKGYTLGSFSKFVSTATYKSVCKYMEKASAAGGDFYSKINESWIHENACTVLEKEKIAVFARSDAVDYGSGLCPIRNYSVFDSKGKLLFTISIDYTGDESISKSVAERLNEELAESGEDHWGYYGNTKHFACGNCHVTVESGSGSDAPKRYPTLKKWKDYHKNWTFYYP